MRDAAHQGNGLKGQLWEERGIRLELWESAEDTYSCHDDAAEARVDDAKERHEGETDDEHGLHFGLREVPVGLLQLLLVLHDALIAALLLIDAERSLLHFFHCIRTPSVHRGSSSLRSIPPMPSSSPSSFHHRDDGEREMWDEYVMENGG